MIKPIKIILLLLLFASTTKGQESIETQKFLSSVFKDKIVKDIFIYTDNIWPARYNDLAHALNPDTLQNLRFGFGKVTDNSEYIVLSKEEKAYIFKCLQQQRTNAWPDHLFQNSRLVLYDTITNIFKDRTRGWPYFHNQYGAEFHSFLKPIFLRNNSVCFFYSDYSCGGLCGFGEFAIYRKKDSDWEKIITLFTWIS